MEETCLKNFFESLNKNILESIIGLENHDSLRCAFPQTSAMYAVFNGKDVDKTDLQNVWAELLNKSGLPAKRAVYINIPFCKRRCLYCCFFRNICDAGLEDEYINCLLKEMELIQSPYLETSPVQAVFIGGGTPSSLSLANCAKVLKGIKKYLPLSNDCEITFEHRLSDLNKDRLETIFDNGVNRISLGVQTFDTALRRAMGRINTQEEILELLKELSSYNQAAIIIDLIYGFPEQSFDMFLADLNLLKKAAIDGFDLYHLKMIPHSPLQKAIENKTFPAAATLAQKAEMFALAQEFIESEQIFSRRSTRHWAKSSRERNLYNILNVGGADIIPFGCGAGGNINGFSVHLEQNIKSYQKQIANAQKPIARLIAPHKMHKLSGLISGQIDAGYLDMEQLINLYGKEVRKLEELLAIWEKKGLIEMRPNLVVLKSAGRFWSVNISQSLLICLQNILR